MNNEIFIGNAKIDSIRVTAEGDLTYDWEGELLLDDEKLSIGGLHIEKDDRKYWCDCIVSDCHYDSFRNLTVVDLELWDDPDGMPESKQDLTEQDLFSNPEFYLWMEHESEMMPNYSIRIESNQPWSKDRVTSIINPHKNGGAIKI